MTGNEHQDSRPGLEHRTLEETGNNVAAPEIHAGGGTAAAASAAMAAAAAELVATLTASRPPRNADRAGIERDRDRLRSLRRELLEAGDRDERTLDELMRAYRTKGESRTGHLRAAAASTLGIATLASEVITISARQVPLASRFTASDLGAAAAIAHGCVTAALLTAKINITMLERRDEPDTGEERELREMIVSVERASREAYEDAVAATEQRIGWQGRDSA